jgi:hypothetical protein
MIGVEVNNFRIVALIGEGAMGAVYRGEHTLMRRTVAIKILRREFAENAEVVRRFINEAHAANAIRHPQIIDILDVGTLPGLRLPYLMMEHLVGEDLAVHLRRRGRVELGEALFVMSEIGGALSAAHAAGIVHRDLKPDNIFLTKDGKLKLLDFGIAKLRPALAGDGLLATVGGQVFGTPRYMAPEQWRGISAEVDQRTDLYALAIILYELLCGRPPFVSPGFSDMLLMHVSSPPPPPTEFNAAVPAWLDEIIQRALAKRKEDRFDSVAAFLAAIRTGGGVPAAAGTLLPPEDAAAATAPGEVVQQTLPIAHAEARTAATPVRADTFVAHPPTVPPRVPGTLTTAPARAPRQRLAIGAAIGAVVLAALALVKWGQTASMARRTVEVHAVACVAAAGAGTRILPRLQKTLVVNRRLTQPTEIVGAPDDPDTLYVLELLTGRVRIVRARVLLQSPLVTVATRQSSHQEEGLLSMAFHPRFADNHRFYLFYSAAPTGATTVDEFERVTADAAKFTRRIYSAPSPGQLHNGGALAFEPGHERLYVSVGDDTEDSGWVEAQKPEGANGRILRIDLRTLAVETWAYGLRNPYRFSFDRPTGDMYIADTGDRGPISEKVFYVPGGTAAGSNFGWRGRDQRDVRALVELPSVASAIIGGPIYRGNRPALAAFCGRYFFGDHHTEQQRPIYSVSAAGGTASLTPHPELATAELTSFGQDALGELYFSTMEGEVYRIDPAP